MNRTEVSTRRDLGSNARGVTLSHISREKSKKCKLINLDIPDIKKKKEVKPKKKNCVKQIDRI